MSQKIRQMSSHVIFQEEQRFNQWWIYLIIAAVTIMTWWIFIQQIVFKKPVGNNPGPDWLVWLIMALVGIGLPLLMFTIKMRTLVYPGHILIRFSFFHKRRIPMESILSFEARDYHPVREFGGWGIRWVPGKGIAYNVSGNKGVELKLTSGRIIMIGSQDEKRLERAIKQAKESGL
jgi:hypothetical protein